MEDPYFSTALSKEYKRGYDRQRSKFDHSNRSKQSGGSPVVFGIGTKQAFILFSNRGKILRKFLGRSFFGDIVRVRIRRNASFALFVFSLFHNLILDRICCTYM